MLKQFNLQQSIFDDPVLTQTEAGGLQETTHGESWFAVETQAEINAISASITGGGEVWEEGGTLRTSGKRPSENHLWDSKKKRFVINRNAEAERLAVQKQQLLSEISSKTDRLKSEVLAGYPQTEIDSFYRQEKEALALQADPNASAPMLREIAENRGVPLAILAQKVLEKAEQVAVVIGGIIGKRQGFEDRIQAVENAEEFAKLEQEIDQWQH